MTLTGCSTDFSHAFPPWFDGQPTHRDEPRMSTAATAADRGQGLGQVSIDRFVPSFQEILKVQPDKSLHPIRSCMCVR